MPAFEVAVRIEADRDAVFELTQDYSRRLDWDPFLREARLMDGAAGPGVGVRAWCVARSGLGMETEYVSYTPPIVAAISMTRGPRLIERFAGSWRFDEEGSKCTRVTFRYNIVARPGWLRAVLDPLLTAVFRRDTTRRLRALKRFAEDGHMTAAGPAD